MRRFEIDAWLTYIPNYTITEINLVPMMVVLLLTSNHPLFTPSTFRTIKNAWSGAAPLDKSLQARFKKMLPKDTPFNQVWGMSETSCIASMLYYPGQDDSGSVGPVIPNCDVKLVDGEGRDITAVGVRGELCIRGPIVVNKYYKNEEANRVSWDGEGYFWTGDVAFFGPRGEEGRPIYIVDRKKVCWFRSFSSLFFLGDAMLILLGTHQSTRFPSCACGTGSGYYTPPRSHRCCCRGCPTFARGL